MSVMHLSPTSLALQRLVDQVQRTLDLAAERTGMVVARETLGVWRARLNYRRQLLRLLKVGPYMIDDIGLNLAEARQEAETPFWRPCT